MLGPVRFDAIELGWMPVQVSLSIHSGHAHRFSNDGRG